MDFFVIGKLFFRSTRETHEFFQRVLITDLRQVEAWWDAEKYGMFTNGDQDKIVCNLVQGEATRNLHAIVPHETFNTRPYHFSSSTDFFLVHFAAPGISKQEAIRQFQLKFRYDDDYLVPAGQAVDPAAMFLHYRVPETPEEPRLSLRRWLAGN